MKKYLLYSILSIFLFSCSEDEIDTYDVGSKRTLLFLYNNSYSYGQGGTIITKRNYADSVAMTFVGTKDEVNSFLGTYPITLVGALPVNPIKINLKVNKELTTAIEGEDYEIDLDTVYLQPNTNSMSLKFKAIRTPKLLDKEVTLAIDLIETDDYDVMERFNDTNIWNDFKKVISGRTFKITFGEVMTMPSYWGSFGMVYFGEWTVNKYKLLNSLMSWTVADWGKAGYAGEKIALGVFPYAATQLQKHLQEQADADKPVQDANGEFMQLPGIYAVDYSRFEN